MSDPESVQNSAGTAEAPPGAPPRAGLVLFFLCAAGFMTFLDVSIVNIALPTIEVDLGISETFLQYIVTAYGTVLGGFLMLGGRLADTYGRRRLLQVGAFLLIERRAEEPLVPLTVFELPVLRTANVTAVLLFSTLVTLFFFASLFMQQVQFYSPITTGLAYLPIAIATAMGAGISSGLVTRLPAKPILVVGLLMAAVGLPMMRTDERPAEMPAG